MFRSALEKTLKANGYVRQGGKLRDLESKIDEAANDGIITDARRRRAHEEVRVLGNDVLHDEWREVKDEEVELAHLYTQRILEDFYDDRETVVKKLIELGRLTKKDGDNETSSSITDTGYDDDGRGASHP
ncbi:MAG: DUF4145 domain-containing protein [Acidobacteria bacterium]|nr:DUF4145 domain-containing protein [Acidobacteriota bacterium]